MAAGAKSKKPMRSNFFRIVSRTELLTLGRRGPCGTFWNPMSRATRAPQGRLMKKHHLQVAYCVSAPPMRGPRAIPICPKPIMAPMAAGRLCRGKRIASIVSPPFWRPEPPMPARARPTMSMLDDWATAQMREPNSKKAKKARKVHLALK